MIFKDKVVLVSFLMVLAAPVLHAQSNAMFSQYMLNGLILNPAYAGSHKMLEVSALYRNQWTGFEGAPETKTFSIQNYFKRKNSGAAFTIINDKIGITTQTQLDFIYSYHIPLQRGSLSLGLMGVIDFLRFRFDELSLNTGNDPSFNENISKTEFNFGTGLYYYTDRFYAGISSPNLKRSDLFRSHWFMTMGYAIKLSNVFNLKPSGLVKFVNGAPVEADINATIFWKDRIWLGGSFRSFDGAYYLAGININKRLSVGYAFDMALTELRKYSSGSHEIMVNYSFSVLRSMVVTPRYF